MTDPNVIPRSMYWRFAGTRPNSSVLAHPSAVVRTLPTKRDPNANNAARMAMAVSVPLFGCRGFASVPLRPYGCLSTR